MNTAEGTASDAKFQKRSADSEVHHDADPTNVDATNDTGDTTAETKDEGAAESGSKLPNGEAEVTIGLWIMSIAISGSQNLNWTRLQSEGN